MSGVLTRMEQPASVQPLYRLADQTAQLLNAQVRSTLQRLRPLLDRTVLGRALRAGDRFGLEAELMRVWDSAGRNILREQLVRVMRTTVIEAAVLTPLSTAPGTLSTAFVRGDPTTQLAIELRAGRESVLINETTQRGIRLLVREALESPLPLTQRVTILRHLVGLTPSQLTRMTRYQEGLLAENVPASQVVRFVARRAELLKHQRAVLIARTEAINAVSLGQQERWRQAARTGALDLDTFRRFWLVQDPCPICAAIPGLNPLGVSLEEPFVTPAGPILHPTVHVLCRCTVILQPATAFPLQVASAA